MWLVTANKNSYSYSYSYSFLAFDKIKEDIRGVAGIKNVLKFFVVAVFRLTGKIF